MTLDAASRIALQELGYDPDDPELEELLVGEQADDLEWLAKVDLTFPLATSVLWSNDSVLWDQRRSVVEAMTAPIVTVVGGGERSGKSAGLKQLTVAQALGGDHPAVQAWVELNDLPRGVIPDGPGRVYALALDSNASARYHRGGEDPFDRYIGPGKHWVNRNGKGEAHVYIRVPGYEKLAEIWFKGVDQGPDAMQGDSIRWWWIDEEPWTKLGKLVYGQLKARVMDQEGRGAISMVAMHGYTWVHDDLLRDKLDLARHVLLNSLHNPHLPQERAASHFAAMSDEDRAVRQLGQFRSRTGAVYPYWAPGDGTREGMGHTCAPFEIPDDWTRFRAADFGLVDPTVVLWGALGDDDTLYIYREYYEPNGKSYRWHAERAAALEGWELVDGEVVRTERTERVETGWGDPAAKEGRQEFAARNLGMVPANNDWQGGVDRVRERLRLQGDERPRLKVFTTCPMLIREMGGYQLDSNSKAERAIKKDDHAPDALRYLVQGIHSWKGLIPSRRRK